MNLYTLHIQDIQSITEKALEACDYQGLLIYSGHPVNYFLDDRPPPHAINPHFKWWVPASHIVSSVIHIRPGRKPLLYLYQPVDFWHIVIDHSTENWASCFDLVVVTHYRDLPDFSTYLNHAWIGSSEFQPLPEEHTNPNKLVNIIHAARTTKTKYEIQCIHRANQLALKGHAAAHLAFEQGLSEFDAHLNYMKAVGQGESDLPYGNIVAYNEHAAVLHYQYQDREPLIDRRSFLIDAGASYQGYAADITRTYSAVDNDFANLVKAMDEIQQKLCDQCFAGQDYVDLHRRAHIMISQLLIDCGCIQDCDAEEAVESGLSGVFFPHGLGHFLGLQVHDVNGYITDALGSVKKPPDAFSFLRLTHELKESMVLTIEPGLYWIPVLLEKHKKDKRINWAQINHYKPYGGIRIEDNVCVTKDKPLNLTRVQQIENI